jgi:hypothetical protein
MATAAFTAEPQADAATRVRLWRPKRLLVTPSALGWNHGRAMAERVAALGVDVVELPSDRIKLDLPDDPRRQYAEAKATVALVVASPSKRRLQPIAPSADWRVDLAEGCPAHCTYCYLAGSLKGPPITRVYANLPEIFDELPKHLGQGLRGVLLHRPAGAGASDGLAVRARRLCRRVGRGRAAPLHEQVLGRRTAAGGRASRQDADARVLEPQT